MAKLLSAILVTFYITERCFHIQRTSFPYWVRKISIEAFDQLA